MSEMFETANGLVCASARPARAVLFDFGGVLTASVVESFSDFSERVSGDRDLLLRVVAQDPEVHRALVDHEEGRVEDEVFEAAVARGFAAVGVEVDPEGLIAGMQRGLHRDDAMIDLVARVRREGFTVVLASNSLGRDCYAGYDFDAMFDAQAISGREGVRKPSREFYQIACRLGSVEPDEAIMIDDLAVNIRAAADLGMGGIVHSEARDTAVVLAQLLGLEPAALVGPVPDPA